MTNTDPKRKNTSSACQPCRASKIRCDAVQPVCGNCSRKERECQYSSKDDKRRTSLRKGMVILSDRVAVLTELLTLHNIAMPPMDPEQEMILRDTCNTFKIVLTPISEQRAHDGPAPSFPSPAATTWKEPTLALPQEPPASAPELQQQIDLSQIQAPGESFNNVQDYPSVSDDPLTDGTPTEWPWQAFESDFFMLSETFFPVATDVDMLYMQQNQPTARAEALPSTLTQKENTSSGDEQESDLIQQVSASFGALRLSSDGQLRYFGAATNYQLLEGSRHDEDVEILTIKHEILGRLEQADLNQEVPEELEKHLLELYFEWHNPSHMTVDREIFFAARDNQTPSAMEATYCSDFLVSCICAIGAAYENRYHPLFITYPRSLTEYFTSRARILLEADLECPNIGTIQGLCLLTSHEAARGRDGRTWLYGGMAMRLGFDLGLHIDPSPYVKAGLLTLTDARVRYSTFWSCVVVNDLSNFHLGRPFRIDSEEITVPTPYRGDIGSEWRSVNFGGSNPQDDRMFVLREWVFLCESLVPLIRKLYNPSSTPITTLQDVSSNVTTQLEQWWQTLPDPLKVRSEGKTPPEIAFLHMAYHYFQILIYRPWTSRRSQLATGQGFGPRNSLRVCSTSASAISILLIQYEKDYGFGRMHSHVINIIFAAALISLINVITSKTSGPGMASCPEATANLSIFFRALDELSRSFPSAKRAGEHLATIQRKWYSSEASLITGKRNRSSAHTDRSQKRLRPTFAA